MLAVGIALTSLVALLHVYFLVLEMFLWKTARGRRVFGTTPEQAEATATLAANQGLYNGFLAAGLAWALFGLETERFPRAAFFLTCIVIAGAYGAATANKRILFVQSVPAVLALAALGAATYR